MAKLPSELATQAIHDRQKVYGHPAEVYDIWAQLITPVLGVTPTLEQCAMILVLLKCAREINAQYPRDYADNTVDIAGFANVLAMVKERHEPSEPAG